jgi:hypothetical protein
MKTTTVLKILKRYQKSLAFMENESISEGNKADAEHYKVDRIAMEEAIKHIERSNTES